jgi:hypothetical protein
MALIALGNRATAFTAGSANVLGICLLYVVLPSSLGAGFSIPPGFFQHRDANAKGHRTVF